MKTSRKLVLLIEKIFPYRFTVARLTKNPLIAPLAHKMLFEKNNLTVLPKNTVVEIQINKKIPSPESIVVPSQVVDYFIEEANSHFIMNFCICRESMKCKNHPSNLGCLFMGNAVKEINPQFGRMASKQESHDHVEKCRKNGLVHLIGRDKFDELWLGVRSGLQLLTVCNCCSCCCLWKMLPNLDSSLASSVKKMPGINIYVTDECTGCKTCLEDVCFLNAIKVINGKATITHDCRICGRCAEICPNNAIKIIIEDDTYIEQTIQRIKKSVIVN